MYLVLHKRFVITLFSLLALVLSLALYFSGKAFAAEKTNKPLVVRYLSGEYFPDVLKLALDKTVESDGEYRLLEKEWLGPKQRMRELLKQNKHIDILWSTTSAQREAQLKAIKFSLLKQLNQYRFLLIHQGEQARYNQVTSVEDLRAFTAASGTHWQDTKIFRRNKLPVVSTIDNDDLAKMLQVKRADYIARGAYEIWRELDENTFNTMQLEQNLLLKYNADYYFFVHPDNNILATRLLKGLNKAQTDGSFDQVFFSVPTYKKGWHAVHESDRIVIELE